jgi:hypothetical protein
VKTNLDAICRIQLCSAMLILLVAFSAAIIIEPVEAASNEGYYHREFEWSYSGLSWTWSLDIPKSLYNTYQGVSDSERTRNGFEGYGFLVTTRDSYVIMLATKLNESASTKGYDAYDTVSFILAFVQSLPYTSDLVTTGYDEYPRFPVETLVDGGGDCEDTSILFATMTRILNYDTIFICPPNHCAVGIWGKNLEGSYYTYQGKTYFYCETTGDGWGIGQLPAEYKGVSAHLCAIDTNTQYNPLKSNTDFDLLVPIILRMVLILVVIVFVAGVSYILVKRKREREAQEGPSEPPHGLPPIEKAVVQKMLSRTDGKLR